MQLLWKSSLGENPHSGFPWHVLRCCICTKWSFVEKARTYWDAVAYVSSISILQLKLLNHFGSWNLLRVLNEMLRIRCSHIMTCSKITSKPHAMKLHMFYSGTWKFSNPSTFKWEWKSQCLLAYGFSPVDFWFRDSRGCSCHSDLKGQWARMDMVPILTKIKSKKQGL